MENYEWLQIENKVRTEDGCSINNIVGMDLVQ